jgi:methanogenic corrinoid protein MtbC1
MVADIMELNGWDTYFLGGNVPENDLCHLLDQKHPDVLCLSLAVFHNYPTLLRTVESIQERYPELPLIVGGQGFLWGGRDIGERFPMVRYLPSLSALEEHLALL